MIKTLKKKEPVNSPLSWYRLTKHFVEFIVTPYIDLNIIADFELFMKYRRGSFLTEKNWKKTTTNKQTRLKTIKYIGTSRFLDDQ